MTDKTQEEKIKTPEADVSGTQQPASEAKEDVSERIGAKMRRIRLEKNLNLDDAAAYLCIRPHFLQAIEDGDLKALPGETYASGFIRSYAAYLGMDPSETDEAYRAETMRLQNKNVVVENLAEIETVSPDNRIILLSLVLLAVLLGVWKMYSGASREDVIDVTRTAETSYEAQEQYPYNNVTMTNAEYPESAMTEAAQVPPVPPKKPETDENADAAPVVTEESPEAALTESVPAPAEPYMPRMFGAKNTDARIILQATQDVWVEVTRGGEVILTRTFHAGDKYRIPADPEDLYLKTGNAGGLNVVVDGKQLPALGKVGETKSKIALDADVLLRENAN